MIVVRSLAKSFAHKPVLRDLSFEVPAGTIYGLLGPNGAGKTTVVSILSTVIKPDAGDVSIAGHCVTTQPEQVRTAIGVTGQFAAVDELLTCQENLQLIADLHHLGRRPGAARTTELLELFGLVDAARQRAGTLSGGMRRRLDIAMSLVGRPRVLFLDEPTTGLDPGSRRDTWRLIKDLAHNGAAIVLTTQYFDEADELADTVGVLHGGRLVAEGSPAELKQRIGGGRVEVMIDGSDEVVRIPSDGSIASITAILNKFDTSESIAQLAIRSPTLDDVFFALTGDHTS